MTKAWIPLYTKELVSDTYFLDDVEFGVYMRLLVFQCNHGRIPISDLKKTAKLAGVDCENLKKSIDGIKGFFSTDSDGNWFNKRMQLEIDKREAISQVNSKSANQRWSSVGKKTGVVVAVAPTRSGEICRKIVAAGIKPNHNNPLFIELIKAGLSDEIVGYAIEEAKRRDILNFEYLLVIMRSKFENPHKKIVARKSTSEYMQSYSEAMGKKGVSIDDDVIDNAGILQLGD